MSGKLYVLKRNGSFIIYRILQQKREFWTFQDFEKLLAKSFILVCFVENPQIASMM